MLHAGVNIHRLTSCTKHFHTMIGLEEWRTCVRAWDAVKGCWFGKTCAAAARRTRLSTAHAEHQHAEPVYGEHKLSVSVFTIIVLLLLAVIVSISTVAAGDIEKKPGPTVQFAVLHSAGGIDCFRPLTPPQLLPLLHSRLRVTLSLSDCSPPNYSWI